MISAPAYCRRFIGRRRQLDFLGERFRAAVAGTGALVLIGGEAGIGKSRLLNEFHRSLTEAAAAASATVLSGRCLEYVQRSFGPFREMLRNLGAELPKREGPSSEPPSELKQQVFDHIADALHKRSRDAPLVALVEDLHWADTSTLEMLQYLAGTLDRSRLLCIGTYRSEALSGDGVLPATVARLERSKACWRVELEPLDEVDLQSLCDHALEGHVPLPAAVVGSIAAAAEGNPLYAEELLKSAIDGRRGSELPLSLAQAVRERMASLEARDRQVVRCASAFDGDFTPELVAAVAGCDTIEAARILDGAARRQLVVEPRDAPGAFAFRHSLTRDAIYGDMPKGESRALHQRIGTILEGLPDAGSRVRELAHHWRRAGDPSKAALYNEAAGDTAVELYDFAGAARYYERALEPGGSPDAASAQLRLKYADALFLAGATDRSTVAYEEALQAYAACGDDAMVGDVALRLARQCANMQDMAKASQLVERCLTALAARPDDPNVYRAYALQGFIFARQGDSARALEMFERAESFAGERRPATTFSLMLSRAQVRSILGERDAAVAELQAAEQMAAATGDLASAIRATGNLGLVYFSFGERERSLDAFERALGAAHKRGLRGYYLAYCLIQYANACLGFGELARVRELVRGALGSGVYSRDTQTEAACLGLLAGLALDDAELVERCAREDLIEPAFASRARRQIAFVARAFAEWHVAGARPDAAQELLHRAVAACESLPDESEEDLFCTVAALGMIDDIPASRALLKRHASLVRRPDAQAQVYLFEAHAARRSGAADQREWAQRAAEAYVRLARPMQTAQALELADRLSDALAHYRSIGDVRDAQRLERRLRPVNRRGQPKDRLTQREQEVAALVTAGMTNKAIAEELVIGERTVETHVASIFAKFGVSSRAELAARVARGSG